MYKLNYNSITGKVAGIIRTNVDGSTTSFLLDETNSDYHDFLKWNVEQKTPLDLKSTIEVAKPVPTRDLAKEIDSVKIDIDSLRSGLDAAGVIL